MRHGPHHGAHRSTRTSEVVLRTPERVASDASAIHGSSALHDAHLGRPEETAGTRFFVPQAGQVVMRALMVSTTPHTAGLFPRGDRVSPSAWRHNARPTSRSLSFSLEPAFPIDENTRGEHPCVCDEDPHSWPRS